MTQVYGWSRGTVRTACGLLEKEGLIRKQQGVGMFVADPLPD
jgi:DNA-binding GntR family transcriptional regulator